MGDRTEKLADAWRATGYVGVHLSKSVGLNAYLRALAAGFLLDAELDHHVDLDDDIRSEAKLLAGMHEESRVAEAWMTYLRGSAKREQEAAWAREQPT